MSNDRSPLADCSTTIGTSGIGTSSFGFTPATCKLRVPLRYHATMRLQNEATPRVERETLIEAAPDEVWESLTEEDRLREWMAPEVELDPVEGGEIVFRDGEDQRNGRVETL